MTTASDESGEPQRRIALVTIGQTPRDDAVPEIVQMIARPVLVEEFGVLDDLDDGEIAAQMPGAGDESLYTRLRDGRHVVVSTSFVARRLAALVGRIDRAGHDVIAIISTGVFERLASRTPLINGQRVVDAWIEALVMGDSQIGIVYPLQRQTLERHSHQAHGTLIQNPHVLALSGEDFHLEDTAARLRSCDLVLMHSVGYTEAMARDMAALTGKPVVTARRIIAGSARTSAAADRDADAARAGGAGAGARRPRQQGDRPDPRHQPPHGRDPSRPGHDQTRRFLGNRTDPPGIDGDRYLTAAIIA